MPIPEHTTPPQRQSARDMVFQHLKAWIEDGVLAPGESIRDSEVATRLGVSRTPVREAIQMLEQLGAVVTEPSRSTRVSDAAMDDAVLLAAPLSTILGLAGELAVPHITPADLKAMQAANERLLSAARRKDPQGAREADYEFHDVLVRAAKNPYLTSIIDSLQLHAKRLDTVYFSDVGPTRESYAEHKAIIAALRRQDAGEVRRLSETNLSKARRQPSGGVSPKQEPLAAGRQSGVARA